MKTRARYLSFSIATALLATAGAMSVACGEPMDEKEQESLRLYELVDDEWESVDGANDQVVLRNATALACTCTVGDGHTQTEGIYSSQSAARADCKTDANNCGEDSASLSCIAVNAPGPGTKEM